ncbi:Detected protein of unknown function [Hibiscus syriacus]|uniref:Uncharacterized protein n=1 Tax=Hibiscus syriacus TaxID=106335 RepID=A0A6A2Y0I4_HIBSY|nr:Detected protein of unknown function [Hibiscus syriacus]
MSLHYKLQSLKKGGDTMRAYLTCQRGFDEQNDVLPMSAHIAQGEGRESTFSNARMDQRFNSSTRSRASNGRGRVIGLPTITVFPIGVIHKPLPPIRVNVVVKIDQRPRVCLKSTLLMLVVILDFGATHHVTSEESNIMNPSEFHGPGKLVVGNGMHLGVNMVGKSHKIPFGESNTVFSSPFELVFTDLWGPPHISSNGFRFYISFIDVFTRHTWLYLLKTKDEALLAFDLFQKLVNKQFGCSIKAVQSDWAVERKHRHVIELGLVLLAQAPMPIKYWSYAVVAAVHLINKLPTKILQGESPLEKLMQKTPDYSTNGSEEHVSNVALSPSLSLVANPRQPVFQSTSEPARVSTSNIARNNAETTIPLESSNNSDSQTHQQLEPSPKSENNINDSNTHTPQQSESESRTGDDASSSAHNQDNTGLPEFNSVHEATMSSSSDIPPAPQRVHHMMTRSRCGIFKPKAYTAECTEDVPGSICEAFQVAHWKQATQDEYDALLLSQTASPRPSPMAPQHGETTGSDGNETCNAGKKREPSKDVLTSIQEKVTRLEGSMTEAKVVLDVLESVDLERLGLLDLDKLESLESIREEVQDSLNELDVKATDRGDSLEAMVVALRKEVEELKSKGSDSEVVELKREVELLKTELLVCKAAFGNSVATVAPKALGDIPKPEKFKGTKSAQDVENFLWGCNDVKRGNAAIETWVEFQAEFKEQFYPEYAEDEARSKLRRLKQEGSLREHVRKFFELMLQVPNLSEEDGFFTFMDGLKPWAKNELRRRGVKELSVALKTAESIIELGVKKVDSKPKPKFRGSSGDRDKAPNPTKIRVAWQAIEWDCPQKNKLSAIKEKDGEESETLKLGSILSTMEVKKGRKKKGLMFVDITIAGQKLSALTVNAKEVPIAGVAKGIELTVGGWSGTKAIKVIPLDDFDFVLGLSFLDRINAFPVPFVDCLCILDPKQQCIIPPATTKKVPDVVSHMLAEFQDVIPAELPKKLPPKREVDHKIELVPNVEPPARAPYRMAPPELEEMRRHAISKEARWFFTDVHRLRALNKLTMKNKYPIPLIADFRSAWWCKQDVEEHVEHLKQVFLVLRENELFVKRKSAHSPKRRFLSLATLLEVARSGWIGTRFEPLMNGKCQPGDGAEIIPGVANYVRRCDMEFVSLPTGQMRERIKEGLSHDPIAPSLIELANGGKTRNFWLDGGLLYARGHRLYVPQFKGLRKELMRECHDSKWAGHPGIHRILALIAEHYYWPHMGNDVEAYVKTCLVCQQDKIEQKRPAGLLQPLPIPEKPWETLSMDFIVGLPVSDGFSSIMVVVDRFSKYGTFILASKVCPAEEAARLFLKYVVKYWGVPKTIISDRDTRFTGRFWKELFKLMGSSLNFSTSVHPQTDGQTERVNALVETYLRHYRSEATNQSPFEIVIGQQPLTPNAAGKRTKKWADRKRRDVKFEVGDLVLAKLSGILRNPYHKGLVRRYEGPFKVLRVGTMAYKLEFLRPSKLIRFHVSYEREVEAIHAEKAVHGVGKRPRHEYLVQWKGLPESEGSWEPSEALCQFRDKIDQFHSSRTTRASLELVGENVTDRQPKTEPSSFKAARDYLCHGAPTIKEAHPHLIYSLQIEEYKHIDINNAFLNGELLEDVCSSLQALKKWMSMECHFVTDFIKDLGELSYFLGIKVKLSKKAVILNQRKFVLELLEKTGMLNATGCYTPMIVSAKLSYEEVSLDVIAFADADWGSSIDDHRSISGHGVFLGSCLVAWSSKKQKTVSRSTMEANTILLHATAALPG